VDAKTSDAAAAAEKKNLAVNLISLAPALVTDQVE
jgi:hypothetical protein